jgi:hypothetical protein
VGDTIEKVANENYVFLIKGDKRTKKGGDPNRRWDFHIPLRPLF